MKKLLELFSILTITSTTISTNVLNNSLSTKLGNQNLYIQNPTIYENYIEKISNIYDDIRIIAVDNNENIYFSKSDSHDVRHNFYVLRHDENRPIKINGISDTWINSVIIDNNNNVYISTGLSLNFDGKLYFLKQGEITATQISGITEKRVTSIFQYNNDIYFGTSKGHIYYLKSEQTTVNQINFENKFSENDDVNTLAVDKDKNIYFGIYQNGGSSNGTYFLKNGETKLKKIIERNTNKIIIDGFNNVYFATDYKTFVLKFTNEEQLISINRLENIENILIDNNNNIYFINDTVYLLAKNKVKTNTPTAKKIDNLVGINIWNSFINKLNNNIYFATSNGAYILRLDN